MNIHLRDCFKDTYLSTKLTALLVQYNPRKPNPIGTAPKVRFSGTTGFQRTIEYKIEEIGLEKIRLLENSGFHGVRFFTVLFTSGWILLY